MKFMQLDTIENQIISLLQEDGRMAFVKMAKKLGVTEGTIRRKYKRLSENGMIKIVALCNPYRIGLDAPAFIGLKLEQRKQEQVLEAIVHMEEVQLITIVTGDFEVILQVVAHSNRELYALLNKIGALDGVLSTHSHLILDIPKHIWNWNVPIDKSTTPDFQPKVLSPGKKTRNQKNK